MRGWRHWPGVAGTNTVCDTFAAGFMFGPRVNAGGRIGKSDLGAKLLSTDDPSVATQLAEHLHSLNTERREIEAQVLTEAEAIAMTENLPMAFVASENWASRRDRHCRLALEGQVSASGLWS